MTADGSKVAMYDSVSGFAFGPTFDTEGDAESFLEWCPHDARTYSETQLKALYETWQEANSG